MLRHGKKLGILIMAVMITSVLGGCGGTKATSSSSSSNKKLKIAVVFKSINSDYWKTVKAGSLAAGKELGVDVTVLGPSAETDFAGQTSIIEDQIVAGVDGLLVAPCQPASIGSTLDKADDAKIPVVLVDTDAPWDKKVSFVGSGNTGIGETAGKFIAGKVGKGAEVAIIRGMLGDATADQRTDGAKKALLAAGVNVVALQPADADRNKGMTVMQNILQTHPNIKAVYATNDEMALGAERALKTANKNIVVVGVDGSPDACTSIKASELTASVAQDSYTMGKTGVETLVKAINGKKVEKNISIPSIFVTPENVDKQLALIKQYLSGK